MPIESISFQDLSNRIACFPGNVIDQIMRVIVYEAKTFQKHNFIICDHNKTCELNVNGNDEIHIE